MDQTESSQAVYLPNAPNNEYCNRPKKKIYNLNFLHTRYLAGTGTDQTATSL